MGATLGLARWRKNTGWGVQEQGGEEDNGVQAGLEQTAQRRALWLVILTKYYQGEQNKKRWDGCVESLRRKIYRKFW
jgi:hypothetical protein